MNNDLFELTIVIVTYKTNTDILKNCLNSIDTQIKTLVVENSNHFENKKKIEDQFSNVKVLCTGSNLGMGPGNNFGLKHVNTKYALILNPDIVCGDDFFLNIKKYLKGKIDFSIIGSVYEEYTNYKPAGFFDNKDLKNAKFVSEFDLYKVDWVAGHTMLVNLNKFEENKIFDENFFLFWEETDLCFRTINKNEKIFMSEDLKINHLGFKSSVVENELSLLKLRNWHYMWSFFYFHKKNFSYFKAFKKTFGRLIRSIIRVIFYSITLNKKNRVIYTYRFLGLINSMIGNKSYYRIED